MVRTEVLANRRGAALQEWFLEQMGATVCDHEEPPFLTARRRCARAYTAL